MIENLSSKFIMDFTEEDTIYMQKTTGSGNNQHSMTFLCRFKEYKGNKVIGVAISAETNPNLHKHDIEKGLEISAYITSCSLYGKNPIDGRSYYHRFKPSGYAIYPQDYEKNSENAKLIKDHPSFGLVRISRRSSRVVSLFGSSITHNEIIALTIARADVDRHLSREWYHAKKDIIEIEMSANQFAEFITTPNAGSGTPCTIRNIEGTIIPEPPYQNNKDRYSEEFKQNMLNVNADLCNNINILKNILDKPSITKGDKAEILQLFEKFTRKIGDTIPFIEKSFVEQMDKTVTEAKGEIESFITRRLTEEGRKVLLGGDGDVQILLDQPK